jgi:hypothetical protein
MIIRSECTCTCHINGIMHIEPCCQPDPTIEEGWKRFKESVVHPMAGENQIRSMKMSFYAGASQIMMYIEEMVRDGLSEEAVARILGNLRKEYLQYYKDLT